MVGSPPRVRGTVKQVNKNVTECGITPACAGNRFRGGRIFAVLRDHPRVCGEQSFCLCLLFMANGSPPRVRGTGRRPCNLAGCHRITPACAGNSLSTFLNFLEYEDHPRVCGEQPNYPPAPNPAKGSPPRVRGTVADALGVVANLRITPACAGNSL